MRHSTGSMLLVMLFSGVVAVPCKLMARSCNGDGDFQGAYGFVGVPAYPSGSSAATPSSTSVSMASPISMFVQAASKSLPVAAAGTLLSDGGGNFLAPSPSGTGLISIGTYTVSSDCSISATMVDAYNSTTSTATGVATTVATSISLEGLISESGTQANLTVTGTPSLQLSLYKVPEYQACTDANLVGGFTLSGVGNWTAGSASSWFSLLGRISADGAGNLVTDTYAGSSPLPSLQLSGTYNINPDCSGTAALTSGKNSYGITFVLVNSPGSAAPASPALQFVFGEAGVFGAGTGSQQ